MLIVVDTDKIKARAFDAIMETFSEDPKNSTELRKRVDEISEKYTVLEHEIMSARIPVEQVHKKGKR